MALTACKECGREVSKKAAACPNCGAPIKRQGTSFGTGCLGVVLVIGLITFIASLLNQSAPPTPSTPSAPSTAPVSEAPRHPFEPAQQNTIALRLQAQRLINGAGERCDAVANLRGGGRVDNGDVFLLADCVGGDTHTMLLTPSDQIRYYMSCESFVNPVC